jgi:6-phosphogluconolactonase
LMGSRCDKTFNQQQQSHDTSKVLPKQMLNVRTERMFAYVGGYTSPARDGRAEGITVFRTACVGEPWVLIQTLRTLANPSLLRIAPNGLMLYAAHGDGTRISAFAVDAVTGHLVERGSAESGGVNPVDLAFVGDGRSVVLANYTSGTVAILPVDNDGTLRPPSQILMLARPGIGTAGPATSMPHGVTIAPGGHFLLIPDKAQDCVFVFRFDPVGRLVPAKIPLFACAPGSGPRHAVFHPHLPMLYVVSELGCSVQLFRWTAATGGFAAVQTVSTLPDLPKSGSSAAEIEISGNGHHLFASNRGDGSIVDFAVDADSGALGSPVWTPCQGKEPRFFTLTPDGSFLHVG